MKFKIYKGNTLPTYKQHMTPDVVNAYLSRLGEMMDMIKNSWGDEGVPYPSFLYRKFLWLPKTFELYSNYDGSVRETRWLCWTGIECIVTYKKVYGERFYKLKQFIRRHIWAGPLRLSHKIDTDYTRVETRDIRFYDTNTRREIKRNFKSSKGKKK